MKLVDAEAGRAVAVSTAIHHRCPFVDELDVGTIDLEWCTWGKTLELHALQDWLLTGFRERRISHEDLTGEISERIARLDGIHLVSVVTHWTTAGMKVTVTG